MKKITATILKEWLLLRRDIAGLLLLLLMPAVLIVVMALVQDAPFRDYQELRFDLLLADDDGGALAQEIKAGLRESKHFHIIDSIGGQRLTDEMLQAMLRRGDYHVGIIIPKGASAEVLNAANIIANTLAEKLGTGRLPVRARRSDVQVRLYFDPVAKPAFRTSISFALDRYVTYSCSDLLVKRISKLGAVTTDTANNSGEDFKAAFAGIGIREEVLGGHQPAPQQLNSVQHNVPAWAIFGMFFIVVPISGHIIREREEGSALRVRLIPNVAGSVALGKILFNTLICTVQFALMCCIGIWAMPLLGLPSLSLGLHPAALLPVILAIGFAATAYGYFVGSVFKTTNQALPFGAISVVILSALGGIWVPVEVLSPAMQKAAMLSPLHWALSGVNRVMLRDGSWSSVVPDVALLLLFGSVMWGWSMLVTGRRGQSV